MSRITGLPERDIEHLSEADKALCRALAQAIQHVQDPILTGGKLPRYVADAVTQWDRARVNKIIRQPMAIAAMVNMYHSRGLPKKLSTDRENEKEPTAFSETARLLQIAETTVKKKRRGTNRK